MTTIVRNMKIPPRVGGTKLVSKPGSKRLTADEQLKPARRIGEYFGADAVAPSVKGVQGVQPSVRGIAAKARDARFVRLAQVAKVAADGLRAIQTIKDSAEAATNPELAALANDPAFMAVISKVVEKIGNEVNGLTKPLTSVRMHSEERALRAKEDSRPILTAEDMARVERARAKLSRLKTAEALGDAGDIVRARFGYEPRAYDSDAMHRLMDRLEGKTK